MVEEMNYPNVGLQYDELAEYYAYLHPDAEEREKAFIENVMPLLNKVEKGSPVLDCACGTGYQTAALRKHGVNVTGSDASAKMLEQARSYLTGLGYSVPFFKAKWSELKSVFHNQFSMVFCCGNAINHCESTPALRSSFSSMRSVLEPDGYIVVSCSNWEKIMASKPDYWIQRAVKAGNRTIIPMYHWSMSTWEKESKVDILFISEEDGKTELKVFSLLLWLYRKDDVIEAMQDSGFHEIELKYFKSDYGYYIFGKA
jgi:glycine/sarcosine N-methyltransferase